MKTTLIEMEKRSYKCQRYNCNDQIHHLATNCIDFLHVESQKQQQQHDFQNYSNNDNVTSANTTYSCLTSCKHETPTLTHDSSYNSTLPTISMSTGKYQPQIESFPSAASKMITRSEQSQQHLHQQQQQQLQPQPQQQTYAYGSINQQQYTQEYYPVNFSPNRWYLKGSSELHTAQTYIQHYGIQQPSRLNEHHMMDIFHLSSSGREARNRAEKNRRDRLNSSIQELSTLIPHVADSPKRVDKIAVLRFATHGLRLKHVFGKSLCNANSQTMDTLMKLLDSFFLTLTCNGQIVLISASVEQHLGHCQADLYGQNILSITHPEDHLMLKQKLIPTDLDGLFQMQPELINDDMPTTFSHTMHLEEEEIDRKLRSDKRTFIVRLAKAGPRSEPPIYELVRIDGTFRRSDLAPRSLTNSSIPSHLQIMRRCHIRDDILPLHIISGNDIELVAIARIVKSPTIQRSLDNNLLEYKTRHLIDGRIVDCDQRISLVAGYMQDEVCNLSPFTFMHQDDVRWVIVALRQMYDCSSSYGESAYRLFTRNGDMIYLHTRGYLEIDKTTNQVHSFICINTQLNEEEGKQRIQEMKKKFSIIINAKIPQSSIDVPASENPQQLERAVLCLIQNLQSNPIETEGTHSLTAYSPHTKGPTKSLAITANSNCLRDTPSLSLIAPTVDTVKTSIVKSVGILKLTGGRAKQSKEIFTNNSQLKDDHNLSSEFYPSCSSSNMNNYTNNYIETPIERCMNNSNENINRIIGRQDQTNVRAVAAKRKLSFTCNNNQEFIPIQRKVIENVITSSLKQLDNTLNEQLLTAAQLRDQQKIYKISYGDSHLNDIMEEHERQREIYNDIAAEFQRKNTRDYEPSSSNKNCGV